MYIMGKINAKVVFVQLLVTESHILLHFYYFICTSTYKICIAKITEDRARLKVELCYDLTNTTLYNAE